MIEIRKAAVLGAGVMGAQIAAHFANAGIPSYLLDLPGEPGNRVAQEGLERVKKLKPNVFFLPDLDKLITVGNFDDDLEKLSETDWIVEAVIERLDIKQSLLKKVEKARNPGSVVSSNTSGIRISQISEGMSRDFKEHFLGTHFFNPPRYMKLLEIIPALDTLPEIVNGISGFARKTLGKGIVLAKDSPNFIANRIGIFMACFVVHYMLENGYAIEEVDELTGPLTGKPRTATFKTLDMVGLDTFASVANNLLTGLPVDDMSRYFKLPDLFFKMIQNHQLGEKTGQGFYKEGLVLDFSTMEYRPKQSARFSSIEMAKMAGSLKDRLRVVMSSKDRPGAFFWKTTSALLSYSFSHAFEISNAITDIDNAMRWGFNWEVGPFELWDMIALEIGASNLAERIQANGFQVPAWVLEMVSSGKKSFYKRENGEIHFYDFKLKDFQPVEEDPAALSLTVARRDQSKIVRENSGATLLDIGDGVLCLEFHSKMNVIGEDVIQMVNEAAGQLEHSYQALVIGNQGSHFSLGANLMLISMLAKEEEWDELDRAVRMFQKANQRLKYAPKPVVAAPHGRTLGGGCEIVLHCARSCAYAESYMGLVEVSAGLVPAGGGIKEMLSRALQRDSGSNPAQALAAVGKAFETIALSKVSTSALEAGKMGFLGEKEPVVMNKDYLLQEAKNLALSAAKNGYNPPQEARLTAFGKTLYEKILGSLGKMQESGSITDYERHLGQKLAFVFSGGDFAVPEKVGEDYFLQLEREAFLSLCREKKTLERMEHLLKYGKPLRN